MSARMDVGLRPAGAGCVSNVWYRATRNAAVLPVPVCACPATSRPESAIGSVWAWIGVQCVKPASRMPCRTGGTRPRLSKVGECGSVINKGLYCCTDGLAGLAKSARKRYKAYQDGGPTAPTCRPGFFQQAFPNRLKLDTHFTS